jgi:hypothetical protein
MELTSRLGEYGSVGAGGADCAAENETRARTINDTQAISSFLIVVFGLVSIPRKPGSPTRAIFCVVGWRSEGTLS